ncbi:hypothetical protein FIBSPDRAFT_42183 [Athelia psychrophila]|uniref:Uncharacterized protein n=1 Tax=Athelia psychrophila TaxID=1759441 RepID=A0A166TYR4_9AGAM|nr:hypothetical protein FIBSPDRAFT_42183 [Fibularhizoctonia sp. CBS 109695]
MILTLTLGLILALPDIFAFSWPASISIVSQHALQQARDSHDPWAQLKSQGISPGEIDALFLQTQALSAYTQKPDDCFQRTAGRVRGLCADLDAGMHEAQRVRAAISMTLCELATASQPPPLECTPFAPPHAKHDSEAEHAEHLQPPCVA